MIYSREFYEQNACVVARELLGARLVHMLNGQRISGLIVETEAYTGFDDAASHAHRDRTPRTIPMWDMAGHSYIYLNYGVHWLLNAACESVGQPAAVLIRAIEPLEGLDFMAENRQGKPMKNWTNGPGKLTKALGLSRDHNLLDLTSTDSNLWIEENVFFKDEAVSIGARIGLGKSLPNEWLHSPRRWWVTDNLYVSR